MNDLTDFIPPIYRPFGLTMAILLLAEFIAMSLALHRISRYLIQRRRWNEFALSRHQVLRAIRAKLPLPAAARPDLVAMAATAGKDPRRGARDEFYSQRIAQAQRPDLWTERALDTCARISPIIGFIGTLAGMVAAFSMLSSDKDAGNLQGMAGPISLAIITTIHGAACSGFCIVVRSMCPMRQLHAEAYFHFDTTWQAMVSLLHPKRRKRQKAPSRPQDGEQGQAACQRPTASPVKETKPNAPQPHKPVPVPRGRTR